MIRPDTLQNRAIFLDRDGTLNVEKGYLHSWAEWEWLPGVQKGLSKLARAGFLLVIVSNQSGIARGYYSEKEWHKLCAAINNDLKKSGTTINAFYFCPHHPAITGPCDCRKPAAGMLLTASRDLNINLAVSWLIGDKASDIAAARKANVKPVLVETGYGILEKKLLSPSVPVCNDFSKAVDLILAESGDQ